LLLRLEVEEPGINLCSASIQDANHVN
jgi:hypothetical protein